jgi:hypothetical protein
MRGSSLWNEGIEHVARHCDGARSEQALAICSRLVEGLKVAQRPPAFAAGVQEGCAHVSQAARIQIQTDEKQKVN